MKKKIRFPKGIKTIRVPMFLPGGFINEEGYFEYRIAPQKEIKNFLQNNEISKNVSIRYEADFESELGCIVLSK